MISTFFSILCRNLRTSQVHNIVVGAVAHDEQQETSISMSILPEELMSKQILSFLEFREIVRLDSAITNRRLRKYFHASLNETVLDGVVDYRHLNWCMSRNCSAKILRVSSNLEKSNHFDHPSHFDTLQLCATANLSEFGLKRMLAEVHAFKRLDVQSFYSLSLRHVLPLEVHLSLIEINANGNTYLREDVLIALVSRCPLLRVIKARGNHRNTKQLPLALAKHCHHLREIDLFTFCRWREEQNPQRSTGYCELFQSCRYLQVVQCGCDFNITNMLTLANSCKELISVSLQLSSFSQQEDTTHVVCADVALSTLVHNNVNIHTLKLSRISRVGDVGLLAVAQNLPHLHTLCLGCREASLGGLAAIRSSCTKLTTFEVCRSRYFSSEEIRSYLPMCILKSLHIYSTTISDAQLVTIARTNPNMSSLVIQSSDPHRTDVQNQAVLSASALCEALSYLPDLKMFYAAQFIFENEPEPYGVRLEDSVLYALVQYCPTLTSVSISGHVSLSNEAISVLSNLTLLRSFDASHCTKLLDSTVTAFAESCPRLEAVDFSNCPYVSNVGINALARCCRRLVKVDLRQCRRVQNSSIRNLIRRARHLQSLSIAQNPQLTFAAVAELPKYCPCLRDIYFFTYSSGMIRKPLTMEYYASYRRNRHYFDVMFGWSEEFRNN